MYSEDPRNRKAPSTLLGFIAITGALILALFLTGILKAHAEDESFEDYNYVTFIRVEGQSCSFVDSQGNYLGEIPTIHNEYEAGMFGSALDNLNQFVDLSSSIAVMLDDHAAKGPYEYIKDELVKRHVSIIEWSSPIDYDVSGFSLKQYPAGMWTAYIYDRSVPLTPTPSPSPTPTPDPNMQEYHVLVPNLYSASYNFNYMFTIKASGLNATYVQPQDSTWNSVKLSYPDITQDLKYNAAILKTGKYSGSWLDNFYGQCGLFYFQVSSYTDVELYTYNGGIVSDPEVMKSIGTVSQGQIIEGNTTVCSYYVQSLENGGYCIVFVFRFSEYDSPDLANYKSNIWFQEYSFSNINNTNYSNPFVTNSVQYTESLKLRLDVENNATPDPNVTPAPPTPTEAPHVIINWPSGTPTPTPPFSVPGNSGTGSGSSGSGSLSPGQIDSTLDTFKTYTENNNAFAFLYACTSVIPDEALYFLFILLFILLLLACIRFFVHFTG